MSNFHKTAGSTKDTGLRDRGNGRGNGPLTIYVKLRAAHTPRMPGTFSPPLTSKETASKRSLHASRHVRHARAGMHVGIVNQRWRGKRSRHSRRNPQFYAPGKREAHAASNSCPRYLSTFSLKYSKLKYRSKKTKVYVSGIIGIFIVQADVSLTNSLTAQSLETAIQNNNIALKYTIAAKMIKKFSIIGQLLPYTSRIRDFVISVKRKK